MPELATSQTRSEATTDGVRVEVRSIYVPGHSNPDEDIYFFAYVIRITNVGRRWVQLKTRHWIITDQNGNTQEVEGPGVVGSYPALDPGEAFEYSSFCPLPTPTGTMRGTFHMVDKDGRAFDAEVAEFALSEPQAYN